METNSRLIFLVLVFVNISVIGQANRIIKGRVVDYKNYPIPYSTVRLSGQTIGTISNEDGAFELKFNRIIPAEFLEIQCLGYSKKTLALANTLDQKSLKIVLDEQAFELNEVIINPFNSKDTVSKAIQKISKNYINRAHKNLAYYRTVVRRNDRYIRFTEAICQVGLEGYGRNIEPLSRKEYLKLSEGSYGEETQFPLIPLYNNTTYPTETARVINKLTSENQNEKKYNHYIPGGPIGLTGNDLVKYQGLIFSKKMINQYQFDYLGYFQNGIYKIKFSPKKSKTKTFTGTLFIEENSLTIISIIYSQSINWNKYYPKYNVSLEYQESENGYSLSRVFKEEIIIEEVHTPSYYTDTLTITHKLFVVDDISIDKKKYNSLPVIRNTPKSFMHFLPNNGIDSLWSSFNPLLDTSEEEKIRESFNQIKR